MSWIGAVLSIIASLLDRLPSRKESISIRIQEIKDEIKVMQTKTGTWTAVDSGKYYSLSNELSKLEKRASLVGVK